MLVKRLQAANGLIESAQPILKEKGPPSNIYQLWRSMDLGKVKNVQTSESKRNGSYYNLSLSLSLFNQWMF